MTPQTLAEAQAECVARKLGPSACADLIRPFCPANNDVEIELPENGGVHCSPIKAVSPRKAAILLAEAEKTANASAAGPPWLVIGAVSLAAVVVVWLVLRD